METMDVFTSGLMNMIAQGSEVKPTDLDKETLTKLLNSGYFAINYFDGTLKLTDEGHQIVDGAI